MQFKATVKSIFVSLFGELLGWDKTFSPDISPAELWTSSHMGSTETSLTHCWGSGRISHSVDLSQTCVFIYRSDTLLSKMFSIWKFELFYVQFTRVDLFYNLVQWPHISRQLISEFVSCFSRHTELSVNHMKDTWCQELTRIRTISTGALIMLDTRYCNRRS